MSAGVEEELFPLPAPLSSVPLVKKARGTMIVSSLRGLREGGYFDAYLTKLPPEHRETIPQIVAGEWVPIDVAMIHYRACDALGLPAAEIVRLGGLMARRLNWTFFGTLLKLAKTSGVTPWTGLAQLPRTFAASFDGGGGTRVVKLGPKEARVELVALALLGIPWFRHGWRGVLLTNAELFCERCYATEVASTRSSASFRLAWA